MPAPPPTHEARRSHAWAWLLAALTGTLTLAVVLLGIPIVSGLLGSGATEPTALAPMGAHADAHVSSDGYRVWARNDDGSPVRWDPCTPIDLVLASSGAPAGFRHDLDRAIALINDASGLHLRVVGSTDERPSGARLPYQPERFGERWAPVLVAWAAPGEAGLPLRDTDRAIAVPLATGPAGDLTYVSGQVVFNRERDDLVPGFTDRSDSWGATVLHELGHLVGLDHVEDPDELMSTYPGSGPVQLGRGDRAGLEAVGAARGCRTAPEAGPVHIERAGGHD